MYNISDVDHSNRTDREASSIHHSSTLSTGAHTDEMTHHVIQLTLITTVIISLNDKNLSDSISCS
jgi:hypothetical protein